MADKYAHLTKPPKLSPAEKAINILGCRMSFTDAEGCVADLEARGPLASIDEHTAVAVLHGRMSHVRAVGCVRDLKTAGLLRGGQQDGASRA